jgi:hypothetical protein
VTSGDLGADGAKSLTATISDAAGNTTDTGAVSFTLDTTADADGNLALAIGDTDINSAEKTNVTFSTSGFDGDIVGSDGVVTFTDSTNNTVSVPASAGAADLSTLADGPISTVLTVTDTAGNQVSVNGAAITLDTTADAGTAATLVIGPSHSSDFNVDNAISAIEFDVAGLDNDATGVVTFSDGTNTVDVPVSANGHYDSIDLSSLTGAITSSLAVVDTSGNSASVAGNTLYSTIQSAITAASGGDTIMVAAGNYDENLTITGKHLTITGAGESGANATILTGQINASGTLTGALTIENMAIDASGHQYGLFVSSDGTTGSIVLDHATISGAATNGFAYVRAGNGSTPTLTDTVGAISITNSEFYGNATTNTGGDGRGDVLLYGYNGDLTISELTIHDPGAAAQKAIQIRGLENGDTPGVGPYQAGGDVSITNLHITGDYAQDLIAVYNVAGFTSFTTTGIDINASAPWGIINLDGVGGEIDLSGFDATNLFAGAPIAVEQGLSSDDTFTGTSGDDVLIGRAGDDSITGGQGSDAIDGGAGTDTAHYSDSVTVTDDGAGHWSVAAGTDGTDTLTNVEKIVSTGGNILLVGHGGFATIQEAVDAASGGETIMIAAGTWSGAGNVNVTIDVPVTIVGMGNGSDPATATIIDGGGFVIDLAADAAGGTVAFQSLAVVNAGGSGINAQDQQILGTLSLADVRVEGATSHGLIASGRKDSTAYDQAGVQHVQITDSSFVDNGQSAQNAANIMLFEFDGDATISNVTASNDVTGPSSAAFGVQIAGFDGPLYDQKTPTPGSAIGSYDVLTAMGNVTIDGLAISGDVRKTGLYIHGYTDTTHLGVSNSSVNVTSGWGKPVIVDPMDDQLPAPAGTPNTTGNGGSFFDDAAANGSYNLAGLTVTQQGSQFSELDGTTKADSIVGTNANDQITGFDGADTITGGAGDDRIVGYTTGDVVDGGDGSDTIAITGANDLAGAIDTAIQNVETVSAAGASAGVTIDLSQQTEGFTVTGSAQDDTITGGQNNDAIEGGAGTDTAHYNGSLTTADISVVAGSWTVNAGTGPGGEGTDTLTGVEQVTDGSGSRFLLVGNGGFATIQDAVDAAVGGETILIAAGTYDEQVVINGVNNLTIEGLGAVIVTAPSTALVETAVSPTNGRSIDGIFTVAGSDNVTIKNLTVDGLGQGNHFASGQTNPTFAGIAYVDSDGGTIDNVVVTGIREPGASFGAQRNLGIYVVNADPTSGAVPTAADLTNHTLNTITIANSTVADFQKGGIVVGNADVNIHDNAVTGIGATSLTGQNGIQVSGSTGSVAGNDVYGIGYIPNTYSATSILTFANNGLSITGNTIHAATDGGLPVSSEGIDVTDSINGVVTGNEIHDAAYGIVGLSKVYTAGELGGTFTVAGNTVDGVPVDGAGVYFDTAGYYDAVPSASTSPMDIEGTDSPDFISGAEGDDTLKGFGGDDEIHGHGGSDTITAGAGDDIIDGGTGSDIIHGEAGIDTARYSTAQAGHNVAWDGTTAIVTGDSDTGADGDTIDGVGKIQFSDHAVLLVGAGSDYTTIQEAIAAAQDGDTILVAAGIYDEDLTINKDVTILGANHGIDGSGSRGLETIIEGKVTVTAASGAVILDGVEVLNTSDNATNFNGLTVSGGADVTIVHSVFASSGENGASGPGDRAIYLNTGATGHIVISGNAFGGAASGLYSDSNWSRGIWSDGREASLAVTGNTFDHVSTAINLDTYHDAISTISGNVFNNSGTGISVGAGSDSTFNNIGGNTFSNVDADFNLRNLATDIHFDIGGNSNVATDQMVALAGAGNDVVTGTDGADFFDGRAYTDPSGADTFKGGAGDDVMFGRDGVDTAVFDTVLAVADFTPVTNINIPISDYAAYNASDGKGWTVNATVGGEGTDTLIHTEIVQGGDPDGAGPATGRFLLVGGGGYATIQAAMADAADGDTVLVADGTYSGTVMLKDGVSLVGASETGVVLNGSLVMPATYTDATVSNLTVNNAGFLLDMRGTADITDVTFDHVAFNLSGDFSAGDPPIGNGQGHGSITLSDTDGDGKALTFSHVTLDTNGYQLTNPATSAFVYTAVQGGTMVLDHVALNGTVSGTAGAGLGAQWNMATPEAGASSVQIMHSHTNGGGNFYVSGFDGVTIEDNVFDGQGLALNGVTQAMVTGNTFENINGDIWANEVNQGSSNQHRGLVIENAWGVAETADVTITGNTFENISAADGALAFQRWTDSGGLTAATIAALNDIDVHGNTFTSVLQSLYLNPDSFGTGAVIPGDFAGEQFIIGTAGADTIGPLASGPVTVFGNDGDDTLIGVGGNSLVGESGADHFQLNSSSPTSPDHILDFNAGEGDTIDFLVANFTGMAAGELAASAFGSSANSTFTSPDERFHYNTATNELSYDADGNGSGHLATVLAELDNGATVAATNIHGV